MPDPIDGYEGSGLGLVVESLEYNPLLVQDILPALVPIRVHARPIHAICDRVEPVLGLQ